MPLSDERIARYARQLLVPAFGEVAQERLAAARVRAVGAGAVASAALVYLVQGGVGRIWIDDPGTLSQPDFLGWLYVPAAAGTPRAVAATAALQPLSSHVSVEPYPVGGVPTAALVAAGSIARGLEAAEAARRAGIPHVVLEPDGEGGGVVSVPPGAPCYACGRSVTGAGRPTVAPTTALGALAASELMQLIASPGSIGGRRVDLIRGVATARATVRLAACACGARDNPAIS